MGTKNLQRPLFQTLIGAGLITAVVGCGHSPAVVRAASSVPAKQAEEITLTPAKTGKLPKTTTKNAETVTRKPVSNTKLFTTARVQESPHHGPQLCRDTPATATPALPTTTPQCGGIPITNWSWEKMPTKTHHAGATWSSGYVLIGTWTDGAFTLSQDPIAETDYTGPRPKSNDVPTNLTPGCPSDGAAWAQKNYPNWHPHAVEVATGASYHVAGHPKRTQHGLPYAPAIPGFVGAWTTNLHPKTGVVEPTAPDQSRYGVLTVSVTGDLTTAKRQLTQQFPGPVCVVPATKTRAEMEKTSAQLFELLNSDPNLSHHQGVLAGFRRGLVELAVLYDDGTVQKMVDSTFGPGIVRVKSSILHHLADS